MAIRSLSPAPPPATSPLLGEFASAMKPFGGEVLQTSLSAEDEKEPAVELSGS
ncbi:DUF1269 domain-containing protein [Paractinoplanes brasiliensis]|uniref:DUF1269 domain-containing protein n=1 Tax=Paractinoplanes brasiliensis TaxID=52695 RepID=UPI00141524E1|nr:DUF1269 domain-containing protein [Actinoplanes brasiliensis]